MNNLSWFIYFADVLPNVSSAAGFTLFWTILGFIGALLFKIIISSLPDNNIAPLKEDVQRIRALSQSLLGWVIVLGIISTAMWIFIPSRDALYMIAASEAGEMVVTSPQGQEILKDLQEVLDAQLEALKNPITTK